jgi:hypothetical protein
MNRIVAFVLFGGLASAGFGAASLARADDANSARPNVTHKQMMKDCMDRERAANSGASEQDVKKTCREKIKSYEDHPSETARPPNNPT